MSYGGKHGFINLQACRQPFWAQVGQVKPTRWDYLYYDGPSSITTKHAKVIQQSMPQISITSQNLPIAQVSVTSVRDKFTWPTRLGATRTTTTQRVPSKHPVDPTLFVGTKGRDVVGLLREVPCLPQWLWGYKKMIFRSTSSSPSSLASASSPMPCV